MESYTRVPDLVGPFLSSGRLDRQLLDSLRLVMTNNLTTAIDESAWGISPPQGSDLVFPGKRGWMDSARGERHAPDYEWVGVQREWIGSFSYLDWEVFESRLLGCNHLFGECVLILPTLHIYCLHLALNARSQISQLCEAMIFNPPIFARSSAT